MKAQIKATIKFWGMKRIDVTYKQILTEKEADEFLKLMMDFEAKLRKHNDPER